MLPCIVVHTLNVTSREQYHPSAKVTCDMLTIIHLMGAFIILHDPHPRQTLNGIIIDLNILGNYQLEVLGLIDVWYIIRCMKHRLIPLTSCWLGVYSLVIGIHFVGCDCDCWFQFFALACNGLHWQATRWVIYIIVNVKACFACTHFSFLSNLLLKLSPKVCRQQEYLI